MEMAPQLHAPWIAEDMTPVLDSRKAMLTAGKITGLAVTPSGDACVSCSLDGSARLFKVPFAPLEAGPVEQEVSAVLEFQGKFGFRGLDHHWRDNKFATVGERVSCHPFCKILGIISPAHELLEIPMACMIF